MADLKRKPTASSKYDLHQTILFLRPMTEDAIAGLDAAENDHYRFEVAPLKKPTDENLVEENPEVTHQSHTSLNHTSLSHTPLNERPCEQDAKVYDHPFALRLGFDTIENPSSNGFTVGGALQCNIKLPGLEKMWYFKIRYLFQTGALMITAKKLTKVGETVLQKGQSLLMMHDTILSCTPNLEFLVEFPDIRNCAQAHRRCYQNYTAQFGVDSAPYLPTSKGDPLNLKDYRTMEYLGKGGYGTVYKAARKDTGSLVAIKIITTEKASSLQEVKMLQTLEHVSQNLTAEYIY